MNVTTNKVKKVSTLFFFFTLLFIFSISVEAGTFTETFGTQNFSRTLSPANFFISQTNFLRYVNITELAHVYTITGWDNQIYGLKAGTQYYFYNESNSSRINTISGNSFFTEGSPGDNGNHFWMFNISDNLQGEDVRFTRSDSLSLFCNNMNDSGHHRVYFIWGNDEESYGVALHNWTSATNKPICELDAYSPVNQHCCSALPDYLNHPCEQNTVQEFNVTFGEILDECDEFTNSTILSDVKFIGIQSNTALNRETYVYLDDLVVTYSNSTNQLPEYNISNQFYEYCQEFEGENVIIPFNISAYDVDGDTIMYAVLEMEDDQGRYIYIDETFDSYRHLTRDYFITNNTVLDNRIDAELYFLGVGDYPALTIATVDGSNNMLMIEKGADEFSYVLPEIITNSTTGSFILGLSNTTVLEFELKDALGDIQLKVKFNHTITGNLEVWLNDVLNYSNTEPYFNSDFENYLTVAFASNNDTVSGNEIRLIVWDYDNNQIVNKDEVTGSQNFKSITFRDLNDFTSYDGKRHVWALDYLTFKGWSYIPEPPSFSSSLPSIIRSESDIYLFSIFISDDYHQPNNYHYERMYISIKPEKYCGDWINDTLVNDQIEDTDELKTTAKSLFGEPFQQYLRANGVYEKGKIYFWWCFWGLFIFTAISSYIGLRRIEIIFPLLVSTTIMSFIALMLNYTANLIAMLILFALALAVLLTKTFISGDNVG